VNDPTLFTETIIELAETLTAEFDIVDSMQLLAERSVALFDADEAGVLTRDPHGFLHLLASTSDDTHLTELFQIQNDQGPCLEASMTGLPVVANDLRHDGGRWPLFAPFAISAGFLAVSAFPMRQRGRVLGALNLFRRAPGAMDDNDARQAQALADIATISILTFEASGADGGTEIGQMRQVLQSRMAVETAKGMVAAQFDVTVQAALDMLRRHAATHGLGLTAVAARLVDGTLAPSAIGD
jgi:transcriptional regulator with GAF, ATPase, and Fis domain